MTLGFEGVRWPSFKMEKAILDFKPKAAKEKLGNRTASYQTFILKVISSTRHGKT